MVNAQKWKKWTIGEMISRTKTTIQTGPFGTVLSASEFVDYGIPIISVREIREGFILITAETPCITDDTYSRLRKYALSEKDIVFARKGSVERSALIPIGLERYFLGSDGIRIRFDQNIVSPDLMLYLFQSPSTKQFLTQSSYGTTMAGLNEKILCALEFYLPETIDEQEKIAKVLADIDHLLALTEKLITKKKAIKQGAMQELLTGKRRLPGFSGNWQTISLKKALSVGHGMSQHDVECPTGRYPILATGGVIGRANRYLWNAPSVLIGRKGTINKPQYMDKPFWSIDTLFYTKINEGYCPKFLYYVFCRIDWLSYNEASGVPSLSSKTIESIEVQVPDYREQCAIAGALTDIDTEIEALEQKSGKYRQVKQGMMQQLLTGKIRLM